MNAIGKHLSVLAEKWNTPGFWSGEMQDTTFVPDASASMTDAELENNYGELLWRLEFWKAWPSTSKEEPNVAIVVSGYEAKKAGYESIMQQRAANNPGTGNNNGNGSSNGNNNDAHKTNWTPYLIGGAAIIFFILKHNKKI